MMDDSKREEEKALVAQARRRRGELVQNSDGPLLDELANALEAALTPPADPTDDEREDPASRGGPIPHYAMLDIWQALYGTSHPEYDEFYAEHGYAETWAHLCAETRRRSTPATREEIAEEIGSEFGFRWEQIPPLTTEAYLRIADALLARFTIIAKGTP